MFGYLLIAAGFAAYGPPTSQDAYYAFTDRILVDVREIGDVLAEEELKYQPTFPFDLLLERCVRKQDRKTVVENGDIEFFGGYECIMEIWPNAEASYRTIGFFRHDGFQWIYHGQIGQARIPSPAQFDPQNGLGQFETKPGSLAYDGDPNNPLNRDYNPYQDHFDITGWDRIDP